MLIGKSPRRSPQRKGPSPTSGRLCSASTTPSDKSSFGRRRRFGGLLHEADRVKLHAAHRAGANTSQA